MIDRLAAALEGRYTIERELGEGGMAIVYLAHDVRHDRSVALKVLRPELAAVIGAERFLAEIRTTANLQHPNILPLFDSGEAEGQLFYVMPYVEGESLRDRLDRERQLPVEDVVHMGVEVAGALDYAHRQDVVHRDIKPENILLHEGRALVADFGIALALSTAGEGRMTETGMSVGTPAYMSPEQAMGGHDVTARSDVYALAATLYEALVGEPPFTGPTAQAIIARIVTEEPRPLVSQRRTIPAQVEAAVLRALERLPADRFESAAELADALEGKLRLPARGAAAGAAEGAREGAPRALVRLSARGTIVAGVAVAALAVAALWGWLRPPPAPPVSRQAVVLGSLFPTFASAASSAIAPDGSAIVFPDSVGGHSLWVKEEGELDPHLLAKLGTTGAPPGPTFSPDGKWIAYTDGKLEKVARTGGAPITLSDSAAGSGAAWLEDGTIVFIGLNSNRLFRTPAAGGPTTRVKTDSLGGSILRIAPVPGADAVLVGLISASGSMREVALDLKTGKPHELSRGGIGAWVVPGGILVYAQASGALYAASFDPAKLALTGPAVPVLEGVRTLQRFWFDATLGADGTLLYVRGSASALGPRWRVVRVSRDGSAASLDSAWTPTVAGNGGLALSPDGERLAVSVTDTAGARSDIYLLRLPDGPATRLTFGGTVNIRPAWSPDGRTVMYASDAGGKMEMWAKRADGSGQPVRVASESRPVWEGFWSPDRKWIVYRTDNAAAGKGDILAVRTGGDSTPVPLVATEAGEESPALSPDGRWLAYISDASGRFEVYVRPFPNAQDGLWQVSTDGGIEPRWSHDGTQLFYRNGGGELVAVDVSGTPTFAAGAHHSLFDASEYATNVDSHYYDVAPDDRSFVMLRSAASGAGEPAASRRMILVRHWLPELREKLKRGAG